MQIAKDSVVSINYTLTNGQGQTLDSSSGRGPLNYIQGAGNLIPGLEAALEGKQAGDKIQAVIPPEQAYGVRNQQLIQSVPKGAFQGVPEVKPGMQFRASGPQGDRIVTVVGVSGDNVTIDANHPLAGETLHFDVDVVEVRAATPEELSHGHLHGGAGCCGGHEDGGHCHEH